MECREDGISWTAFAAHTSMESGTSDGPYICTSFLVARALKCRGESGNF